MMLQLHLKNRLKSQLRLLVEKLSIFRYLEQIENRNDAILNTLINVIIEDRLTDQRKLSLLLFNSLMIV